MATRPDLVFLIQSLPLWSFCCFKLGTHLLPQAGINYSPLTATLIRRLHHSTKHLLWKKSWSKLIFKFMTTILNQANNFAAQPRSCGCRTCVTCSGTYAAWVNNVLSYSPMHTATFCVRMPFKNTCTMHCTCTMTCIITYQLDVECCGCFRWLFQAVYQKCILAE